LDLVQIRNYKKFLPEIIRILRPGGMFLFSEYEFLPYEGHDPNQLASVSAPYALAITTAVRAALEKQGISVDAATRMPDWLAETGRFSSITKEWRAIPTGSWHPDPLLQEVGLLSVLNAATALSSFRPLLKSSGLSDETIDELLEGTKRDFTNPLAQIVAKFHVTCAYKV